MSEFIKVEIHFSKCVGIDHCGKCCTVCPVNIFQKNGDLPEVIEENQDECTLCDLCMQGCSEDAITIWKLYE